ncbi:N-acetyltransferase [Paractinoplanes deccanensis]|uniref:N-acetyltransferase n=1 Tax=Paractinoplanes deccanensis TaxID=113561 RepID=A0ABQ3YDJ0_9ACTN|nr:GNAT family N-acetyltransferase [Actinoplanes deccanensis]GID78064.1 N-acetyltransferase [Actinoplanes deccanensis]
MDELLADIVAVTGASRWQAVAPRGFVAGRAGLRPLLVPAARGAAELSLYVEPAWRRRGIGSRLLAVARDRAAGLRLVVDVPAGSPGEAFCLRHGFRRTGSQRRDLLTYCDVHQAWLGELVDSEHPGYRLAYWTGDLPDIARVEDLLRVPSRPGNAVLTAADAAGELAAYAMAVVDTPFPGPRARQYGPAVLPGHRGRRLGPWVNAALIQRLQEVHPHITEIETTASHDDDARRHLGFRPFRRARLYELPETESRP